MHVYFISYVRRPSPLPFTYDLSSRLKSNGDQCSYLLHDHKFKDTTNKDLKFGHEICDCFFEHIDRAIIDLTKEDRSINRTLGYVTLHKVKTLCLYQKQNPPKEYLKLLKLPNIPPIFTVLAYQQDQLHKIIEGFLGIVSVSKQVKNPEKVPIKT